MTTDAFVQYGSMYCTSYAEWRSADAVGRARLIRNRLPSYRKKGLFAAACLRSVGELPVGNRFFELLDEVEYHFDHGFAVLHAGRLRSSIESEIRYFAGSDWRAAAHLWGGLFDATSQRVDSFAASARSAVWAEECRLRMPPDGSLGIGHRSAEAAADHMTAVAFHRAAGPVDGIEIEPHLRTTDVIALAWTIHDDKAFDRMTILADALEDAGFVHADVLGELRGPGPFFRGYWLIDSLLEKT